MPWFRFLAGSLLLTFSITGVLSNLFFIIYTFRRPKFQFAFYTLSRTKALANALMALSFLIWPTVGCFIGHLYLPPVYNRIIGQFAGIGVYMVGPIIQLLISVNRTMATCFPIHFAKSGYGSQITWVSISLSWIIGVFYFFMGLSDGCAFIFNMELFSWVVQDSPCAVYNIYFLLYSIAAVFCASSIFNLCTFVQIMRITKRINGAGRDSVVAQERKNRNLFIQNIILDSFIMIDMVIVTFCSGWITAVWYQFLINSLLWLAHLNADGASFLLYNCTFGRECVRKTALRSDPPMRQNQQSSISKQ